MSYYIYAGKLFLENKTESGGYLEVQDDGNFDLCYQEDGKPSHGLIKEYDDQWIAPGYVDMRIHGLFDEDMMKSNWKGVSKISEDLLQTDVTSWLLTTITASDRELTETCEEFAAHKGEETGAKVQELHFEGPFSTPRHSGAENPKYITGPSIMLLREWRKASNDMSIKISMAPERKDTRQFVREATGMGLVVALEHSDSDSRDAIACVEAGTSVPTHTFNGMNGLSQHPPNIVGAAFSSRLAAGGLICDGHHVEEPAVHALVDARGPERTALVTDCMQTELMPDGDYVLDELPVYAKDGMARLKDANNLADSILLLRDAVENVVNWSVATPEDAVVMASYAPAKSRNLLGKCGAIKPGHPADFVVLNHDMTVNETYLNDESHYKA